MGGRIKKEYGKLVSSLVRSRVYLNTYMTLSDNTHMEIENCKKILEYNDAYVKVRTATLIVSVWGQDLRISDYNTDGIVINGKFSSVEFEQTGGRQDV